MVFEIFGIKFYLSYVFVSLLTAFAAIDKSRLFLPTLFSVILHEAAHLFILLAFGCKIRKIKFTIGEIGIEYITPPDKTSSILSLLAGPITNLIVSYFFFCFSFELLFGLNLILGIVNLLPIIGLDGGSIVEKLLEGYINPRLSKIILFSTSVCSSLTLLTINRMFLNNNFSIIIFSLYLILPVILKNLLKENRF